MEVQSLQNYINEDYLKRFRVFHSASLFDPTPWELYYYLHKFKCPICLRSLYWRKDKKIAYCKSIKKDKFVITREKLKSFGIVAK